MYTLVKRFYEYFLVYAHWFIIIRISQLKDHPISVEQAIYATSVVAKYLYTATIKIIIFNKTTLPHDMVFNK